MGFNSGFKGLNTLSVTWRLRRNLTFICPYIASISLKYNQEDATFSRSIYLYKLLYMFQAVPPPIIRSTKLHVQRQVLSNQYSCLLLSWVIWNCKRQFLWWEWGGRGRDPIGLVVGVRQKRELADNSRGDTKGKDSLYVEQNSVTNRQNFVS